MLQKLKGLMQCFRALARPRPEQRLHLVDPRFARHLISAAQGVCVFFAARAASSIANHGSNLKLHRQAIWAELNWRWSGSTQQVPASSILVQ